VIQIWSAAHHKYPSSYYQTHQDINKNISSEDLDRHYHKYHSSYYQTHQDINKNWDICDNVCRGLQNWCFCLYLGESDSMSWEICDNVCKQKHQFWRPRQTLSQISQLILSDSPRYKQKHQFWRPRQTLSQISQLILSDSPSDNVCRGLQNWCYCLYLGESDSMSWEICDNVCRGLQNWCFCLYLGESDSMSWEICDNI
jgi:hypothetical protein